MATTRQKKEEILQDLAEKFANYTLVIFVNYRGLNVQSFEKVRNELRKVGIDVRVAKKTLLNLALGKLGIVLDLASLEGQLAAVFGYTDVVLPAKAIYKFTKEFENLKILLGILGKEVMGSGQIVALAQLPSYEELLGKVVGSIQAPIAGFVNVMQGNIRGLVQVLNAISQKSNP